MCGLELPVLSSEAQGSWRKGGQGRQGVPPRGLSQTLLQLNLTSTPQRRQGQRRKLRPREVTEAEPPSRATCSGKPANNLTFHGQGLHILPRAGGRLGE